MLNKISAKVDLGTEYGSPFGETVSLGNLISVSLNLFTIIAGILLLFLFIFYGYKMIAGAGKTDPRAAEQARNHLIYIIIGFIIVAGSFWIIQLLETITGAQFFTNPSF